MNNKGKISLKTIIYFIVIIAIIFVGVSIYRRYNFYDYTKGVREDGKTSFMRDSEVTYSDMDSYKIENADYNDAMFYKTINVEPNTPYRVTCMVKTENVETLEGKYTGGAQIAINGTTECSEALIGSNDWSKITFMFNSNDRNTVELGFRLGGYEEQCKGTAWFSDFTIEAGALDQDNNWNVACFIIENIEANVEGIGNVQFNISFNDVKIIRNDMKRFQESIKNLSNNKMSVTYDVIEISEPVTTLSYDEENGYYVGAGDVRAVIDEYVKREEYDYIYVVVQLGNINDTELNLHNWIGLRSYGI